MHQSSQFYEFFVVRMTFEIWWTNLWDRRTLLFTREVKYRCEHFWGVSSRTEHNISPSIARDVGPRNNVCMTVKKNLLRAVNFILKTWASGRLLHFFRTIAEVQRSLDLQMSVICSYNKCNTFRQNSSATL